MKELLERIHPDDQQRLTDALNAAFVQKRHFDCVIRIKDLRNHYLHFHSRGQIQFNAQDQPVRLAGSITDITAHRLEEEALQISKKKLEQINRDLERFASTVSHDLQSPIRKSAMFIERMTDEARSKFSEQALDYFERLLFSNLICNSLKFQKKAVPPVIRITGKLIDDHYCEIIIEDNGIGFQPDQAEQIFNSFERLNINGDYPGTGLGLAISKQVVERHGGSISAIGAPNQGSTFMIKLPVKHESA